MRCFDLSNIIADVINGAANMTQVLKNEVVDAQP